MEAQTARMRIDIFTSCDRVAYHMRQFGCADRIKSAILNAQVEMNVEYILYSIFYFPTNHTKLAMTPQIFNFSCGENDSYPS
jgi:hypothetical protein